MNALNRFLLIVGLPLASSYATLPSRTGSAYDDVAVGTESAGQKDFRPPLDEFPTDTCANLDQVKVLSEPGVYCGSVNDPDACAPGSLLYLSDSIMTSSGLAVKYDTCAWDDVMNKCRMASYSYICDTQCPGVPTSRARSDPGVTISTKCSDKMIETASTQNGGFPTAFVRANTCEQILSQPGRRALEEPEPMRQPKKRKLSGCFTMQSGGMCCETALGTPESIITAEYKYDPDAAQAYVQQQACSYKSSTDECICDDPVEVEVGSDNCPVGPPRPWGWNGGRRK